MNLNNFHVRRRDDILVSAAGPAMNLLIAVALLGLLRLLDFVPAADYSRPIIDLAFLSLFLCFFNLLPIPPLDGGHILRNLVGMTDEAIHDDEPLQFHDLPDRLEQQGAVRVNFVSITNSGLILLGKPMGLHLGLS